MTRIVAGIYQDTEAVVAAVEGLLEKGVPVDEISVVLRDSAGSRLREIPVNEEPGAREGAVVGGTVGASLGALGIPLAVGSSITPGLNLFVAGPIVAGMIAAGGVVGGAIGAPMGFGKWHGLDDVSDEELERGSAVVGVHSDELAEIAREVLVASGAARVTDGDGGGTDRRSEDPDRTRE